ncbi:hypothetical protein BH11PSE12_BH11PSE12_05970 [soil metagenome]
MLFMLAAALKQFYWQFVGITATSWLTIPSFHLHIVGSVQPGLSAASTSRILFLRSGAADKRYSLGLTNKLHLEIAMKNLLPLLATLLLSPCYALDSQTKPSQSLSPAESSISHGSPTASPVEVIRGDIGQLKIAVAEQKVHIESQQRVIDVLVKSSGSNTSLLTALGVVIAAAIGGFFAVRNQNKQAVQERLLKAVELIMDSRSGYQAEIRRKNLAVFLDAATDAHLANIKEEFSGPEFTDLHVALAQAMSAQATTPAEVLDIWRQVLKGKKFFDKVEYPKA